MRVRGIGGVRLLRQIEPEIPGRLEFLVRHRPKVDVVLTEHLHRRLPGLCGTQTFTSETASVVSTCSASSDGGSASDSVTLKIDKTGPSASLAVVSGTLGLGGWYTSDVTVRTSGADDVSSPVSCVFDQQLTSDTAGTDVAGNCTNDAGLTTHATALTVKIDKTAPVIGSLTPSPGSLWPPNHKMVNVTVGINATDNLGAGPSCAVTGATSSEPDNGLGDGDTAGDVGTASGSAISLRAERAMKGPGRIYTVGVTCTDEAGNTATGTTTVSVPSNKGRR